MKHILAIDQSTSATKGILFDAVGRVVDRFGLSHRQIQAKPGWVEHDAGEIWNNVLGVVRHLAKGNQSAFSCLAALSIANQRETVVVFDRATGHPLHHALVWQDRRGAPFCQKLNRKGLGPVITRKTGLNLDTYFSGSKLHWLVRNHPDLARRLRNGSAVAGTMDAYLIHRLTGGRIFATDHTNASRTLLYNIHRLEWDKDLCRMFQVPVSALPETRESSACFGETDFCGLLPAKIPICGVMGDSQAALFAQQCFKPGQAKVTFGTGTSLLVNMGSKVQPAFPGGVTALAWVLKGQPTYATEGLISYSAATVEWLIQQMGLFQNSSELEPLARSLDDNGGVYLVPAFAGLRTPRWDPDARAAIVGLSAFAGRAHVARAALESIAYQIRDVLDAMKTGSGVRLKQICADGGPTQNDWLMQFTADITGVKLFLADKPEASAWGAAMQGLLGLGIHRNLKDLAELNSKSRQFKRHLPASLAKHRYLGWQKAVQRVLSN